MAVLAALASVIGPSAPGAYGAALWNQLDPGNQLDPAAAASGGGPSSGHPSNIITYSEDAPCDPTPVAAKPALKAVHRPKLHRAHRGPVVHKSVVHKVVPHPSPVLPKPVPVIRRPAIHKAVLHKVVAHRPRRRRPAAATVVAAPKRCVTLHSERLNRADLAYDGAPAAALDPSAALAPPEATPDFGLGGGAAGGGYGGGAGGFGGGGGGGAAFPNSVSGSVGGGGVATDPGHSSGSVSAAPEPQTWMLMIMGVGLCGAALRRARRKARFAV
jgi:hypothetical protein